MILAVTRNGTGPAESAFVHKLQAAIARRCCVLHIEVDQVCRVWNAVGIVARYAGELTLDVFLMFRKALTSLTARPLLPNPRTPRSADEADGGAPPPSAAWCGL